MPRRPALNPTAIVSLTIGTVGLAAALVGLWSLPAAVADQSPATQEVPAAAAAAPSGHRGGRLVIADPESNTSLDPFVTVWHSYPHAALFASLFDRTADLRFVGYLADTWQFAPDGRVLTVTLVKHASFSDGTPVDAEAVRWNLTRYADPQVCPTVAAFLSAYLESVTAVDQLTVRIQLRSPYAPLLGLLGFLEIVSPTAYQRYGREHFGTHPVGAGPFVLKELTTDNRVVFARNPEFTWAAEEVYGHRGPVYLDEFEIRFINEEQTAVAALEAGEIHCAEIPAQDLAHMRSIPQVQVHSQMVCEVREVSFNTSRAPWDNAEMRRALAYAVDREELVALAWSGQAAPLYQPLPPTIWGHNPAVDEESYHFDPDRSRQMLDSLGYVDANGDLLREAPDGSPWTARLSTASEDIWRRQAEVLEAQFRDVGLTTQIELLEHSALNDILSSGNYDLALSMYAYNDPSILTYCFGAAYAGGSNRTRFSTPELTRLLAAADSDMDPTTRYATIQQIQRIVIRESPWIFLVVPHRTYGIRRELRGWSMHPEGYPLFFSAYFDAAK